MARPLQFITPFLAFRFQLSDPKVTPIEKAAQDPERKVTFTNLTPGRLYNISSLTVSGGVASKPLVKQDRLHPEPVANIDAANIKDKEITLFWTPPIVSFKDFITDLNAASVAVKFSKIDKRTLFAESSYVLFGFLLDLDTF